MGKDEDCARADGRRENDGCPTYIHRALLMLLKTIGVAGTFLCGGQRSSCPNFKAFISTPLRPNFSTFCPNFWLSWTLVGGQFPTSYAYVQD